MKFSQVKEDLEKLDVGEMIEDEPMYKHTTYKVGGPARIYLKVKDVDSLIKTIKYCGKHRVKYLVIGRGSNLLFSDREYEGLIISLNECFNEIKVNGSCVVGILGKGSRCFMLRSDMDGLPFQEESGEEFASRNGRMHACGHDGHATIGLGVAKVLMSIKDQLHGTVKLIFQPAEEGVRGAKSIVDNGHLDGVDYLIGSHVTNKKEDDPAVVIPGSYGSLATTKYDVIFHGKSAHAGGSPEVGRNVMLAVGTAILNLYAIPRHSGGVSRVNVGTVVAGSGRNVIADEAKMEIEVRGETTEINEYMKNYAVNIIESAAKMHGCTCEMKLMGAANSLASSEALMERVKRVCEEDLHLPVAKEMSSKNGGSEDVSYMMNRVQEQGGQATFMRVLTHEAGPGHSRIFDIDEQVLPNAVKIFCGVVYDIMH